ncbi:MAG: lysophospholipid acyltransferase family protein [bacterium]|nr:lysophospholipid acyltransferase family protein [bacterium]
MDIRVINQSIINIAIRRITKIFADFKVYGKANALKLKKEKNFLLMVNHHSRLDPFVAGSVLPLREVLSYCPFYFMTHEKYMVRPIIGPILRSFGSYQVSPKSGTIGEVLKSTEELITQGKNIMIFPEGRLILDEKKRQARPGIAYLARKYPDLKILPINLAGTGDISPLRFFLFRNKIRAYIGKSFSFNDYRDSWKLLDDRELAQAIMAQVWNLVK